MFRLRNTSLTILTEDTMGNFVDLSDSLWTYQRDTEMVTLTTTDKLWIGFEKPINSIYPYFNTLSSVANALSIKYFDGTNYVDTTGLYDDTKGFTRNGFIRWDTNQNQATPNSFSIDSDQVVSTVNGLEQYWYELTVSMDTSQMVIQGLNLIFSDTEDLKLEEPNIESIIGTVLPTNGDIMVYEAVMLDIVKALRAQPITRFVFDTERDVRREPINQWDVLNIEALNAAARNLTLSKIYFLSSTQPNDVWAQKADYYRTRYEGFFSSALLSIDYLGTGQEQVNDPSIQIGHPILQRD